MPLMEAEDSYINFKEEGYNITIEKQVIYSVSKLLLIKPISAQKNM